MGLSTGAWIGIGIASAAGLGLVIYVVSNSAANSSGIPGGSGNQVQSVLQQPPSTEVAVIQGIGSLTHDILGFVNSNAERNNALALQRERNAANGGGMGWIDPGQTGSGDTTRFLPAR